MVKKYYVDMACNDYQWYEETPEATTTVSIENLTRFVKETDYKSLESQLEAVEKDKKELQKLSDKEKAKFSAIRRYPLSTGLVNE